MMPAWTTILWLVGIPVAVLLLVQYAVDHAPGMVTHDDMTLYHAWNVATVSRTPHERLALYHASMMAVVLQAPHGKYSDDELEQWAYCALPRDDKVLAELFAVHADALHAMTGHGLDEKDVERVDGAVRRVYAALALFGAIPGFDHARCLANLMHAALETRYAQMTRSGRRDM